MDINKTDANSITLLPAFGGTARFSSLINQFEYGDSHKMKMSKGINSLKASFNLRYDVLTDSESQDLISFLQSRFYYEIQNYDAAGKFDNKRIEPFDFTPFYPYKTNKFLCLSFEHSKLNYNNHSISTTLESVGSSILDSVESEAGHNSNIDSIINAALGANSNVLANTSKHGVSIPQDGYIFHSGDYVNARLNSAFTVAHSSSNTLNAFSFFDFPTSHVSCGSNEYRHSIFIDSPGDCFYYPYEPITSRGNLDVRMFDFIPDQQISLRHQPKYKSSNVTDFYIKYNKYGFNPNLNNFTVTFRNRSDLEAKRILLFLESHLGYKNFGFCLHKNYAGEIDDSTNKTPHRKATSFFYCPEWEHTFVYKNTHDISATFIECLDY